MYIGFLGSIGACICWVSNCRDDRWVYGFGFRAWGLGFVRAWGLGFAVRTYLADTKLLAPTGPKNPSKRLSAHLRGPATLNALLLRVSGFCRVVCHFVGQGDFVSRFITPVAYNPYSNHSDLPH